MKARYWVVFVVWFIGCGGPDGMEYGFGSSAKGDEAGSYSSTPAPFVPSAETVILEGVDACETMKNLFGLQGRRTSSTTVQSDDPDYNGTKARFELGACEPSKVIIDCTYTKNGQTLAWKIQVGAKEGSFGGLNTEGCNRTTKATVGDGYLHETINLEPSCATWAKNNLGWDIVDDAVLTNAYRKEEKATRVNSSRTTTNFHKRYYYLMSFE